MATPFAALETRLATACAKALANATADFGGGVTVDGVFRDPTSEAFGGLVGGSKPSFEAESTVLAGVANGAAVSINGTGYTVRGRHPEAGMTTLVLESAA